MALADSLISMAGAAVKQNPELVTNLASSLTGSQGAEFLKKLAENPVFKEIAMKLVTTEAFQNFIVKLAGSELGKTIVVNGMQFLVTQQMQNGLSSALGTLLGNTTNTTGTTNTTNNVAANVGGQIAMSVLGNLLGSKK